MAYILAHRSMVPPQYIAGNLADGIAQSITHELPKALVFPTMDDAIAGRRELNEFAELFDILPHLEIAHG